MWRMICHLRMNDVAFYDLSVYSYCYNREFFNDFYKTLNVLYKQSWYVLCINYLVRIIILFY